MRFKNKLVKEPRCSSKQHDLFVNKRKFDPSQKKRKNSNQKNGFVHKNWIVLFTLTIIYLNKISYANRLRTSA